MGTNITPSIDVVNPDRAAAEFALAVSRKWLDMAAAVIPGARLLPDSVTTVLSWRGSRRLVEVTPWIDFQLPGNENGRPAFEVKVNSMAAAAAQGSLLRAYLGTGDAEVDIPMDGDPREGVYAAFLEGVTPLRVDNLADFITFVQALIRRAETFEPVDTLAPTA